jgi:membrane associated rhomboid family serine protease
MDLAVKRFYISLVFPVLFVIVIWLIFILDQSLELELHFNGLFPRKLSGLKGIAFFPLIHGSLKHLIANTFPLLVLGTGIFYFYRGLAVRVFLISYFVTGIAMWIFARPSYHIGASGLIYSLAGFLFLSGVLRRHIGLMAVSLIIVFQYGSLVWGIFPLEEQVSWEGHLLGLVVGSGLAIMYRKLGPQRISLPWEREGYEEEDDDDIPWDDFEIEGKRKI